MGASRKPTDLELAWRQSDNIVNPFLSPEEDEKLLTIFRKDPAPFIEKYLKINTKEGKITDFKLKRGQRIVNSLIQKYRAKNKPVRLIILKARQVGISTYLEGLIFWRMRFWRHTDARIVSFENGSATKIFNMTELYYESLPENLRPLKYRRTKGMLIMGNPDESTRLYHPGLMSGVEIGTAKNVHIGRGSHYQCAHLTEAALWNDAYATTRSLLQCIPSEPETYAFIESTSNGADGYFYDEFMRARERLSESSMPEWYPVFLPFWLDEGYEDGLTDEEALEIAESSDEYEKSLKNKFSPVITWGHISWRRKILSEKCQGIKSIFDLEYAPCLVADTLVSTEKGILRLGQAHIATRSESGEIEKWMEYPPCDIWEVRTSEGRVLRGNHHHPVKTVDKDWVWMSRLKEGDTIVLQPPMFSETFYEAVWHPILGMAATVAVTEDWALFVGYFMGDGNWYKTRLNVACDAKDEDVIQEVTGLLSRLFNPGVRHSAVSRVQGRKGCVYVSVQGRDDDGRSAALTVLDKLRLIKKGEKDNCRRRDVHVPEIIFRSPKNIVRMFLSALFECDGTVNSRGIVSFSTAKEKFAQEIQLLLLGFGITGKIINVKKPKASGGVYESFQIWFGRANSNKFHEEIGFRGYRKKSKASLSSRGKGRPSDPIVMEDTVLSVINTGVKEPVYDFTIKNTHQFSANGILTHNTVDESFAASGQSVFDKESLIWYRTNTVKNGTVGRLIVPDSGMVRRPYFVQDPEGPLTIWEHPQEGMVYGLGCDAALGTEPQEATEDGESSASEVGERDFCAGIVLSANMKQVAQYNSRVISAYDFGDEMANLGIYYNTALLMPETGAQGAGYAIQKRLKDIQYPLIGRWEKVDSTTNNKTTGALGWEINFKTKQILIADMQREIKRGSGRLFTRTTFDERNRPRLAIRSMELLRQLQVFANLAGGGVGAKKGSHDDLVIALGLALKALEQSGAFHLQPSLALSEEDGAWIDESDNDKSFWEM